MIWCTWKNRRTTVKEISKPGYREQEVVGAIKRAKEWMDAVCYAVEEATERCLKRRQVNAAANLFGAAKSNARNAQVI